MIIKRDLYLNKLIERKRNGLIKVITWIRKCGKSFLLFKIFKRHLLSKGVKEDHPFVKDDENFLIHIGAAKRDNNGVVRPTKAGLLMFGNFYDITNVYPNYFLDYQDHRNLEGDDMRWSFRITSTNGDWSGNLYDFYYRITFKLTEDIAVPFKMNGMFRDVLLQ